MFMEGKKSICLMYHDVGKESGFQQSTAFKYKLSPEEFEKQISSIKDYLMLKKIPSSHITFTFDDGGVSFYTIIAPILEKYGFKGIFYISTSFIGTEGFLNRDQIKELYERGHIIGNHSHSHPPIMSSLNRKELSQEWRFAQNILKEILGFFPEYASLPGGSYSKTILGELNQIGIKHLDTSIPTTKILNYKGTSVRGRYVITEGTKIKQIFNILSHSTIRKKMYMRYKIMGIMKKILGKKYNKVRKILNKNR